MLRARHKSPLSPYCCRLQFRHFFSLCACHIFFSCTPIEAEHRILVSKDAATSISVLLAVEVSFSRQLAQEHRHQFPLVCTLHYSRGIVYMVLYHRYVLVCFRGSVFGKGKIKWFRSTTVCNVSTAARRVSWHDLEYSSR